MTIAEIRDRAAEIAGREVSVRGKVVRCASAILGRNWLHLRDATSGTDGPGDLTITTNGAAAVGSTALVRGTVAIDRDYGYGYRYDLVLENARIDVE